jgi:hypothetical protein
MRKDKDKGREKGILGPDPVSYMRSRHPDQYSDSEVASSLELTQGLLEYHLETLTNRNQETEFAYFARRLAEKEICPNLRPQTGPTGGGDSKADSETIPVSSELAELWVGSDPVAGNERWAFAFSAKKDWKSKVRSDVRSIVSAERGYTRIYFITNQFAPDKSRSSSEDTLSKENNIRVVILDRTWITKAVIENGRANIAIEALRIEELRPLVETKVGPADVGRQHELEELEKAIADPDCYRGARYQQVEDALRAAILARELGRSQTEIDGLFIRAERLARDPENLKQRLRIAYAYAWTAIFWLNNVPQLSELYDTVENFALKSDQMDDVELVQNLWMVLVSQVRRGVISASDAKIESRKASLKLVLNKLTAEEARPNNALRARTSLALLAAQEAYETGDTSGQAEVWNTLAEIVKDADHLGDYPFERLARLVEELAEVGFDDIPFDALFESVILALEKRRGETAGAGLLRDRGFQKLVGNKPYEAIGLLGRAMERFAKREHRDDLISCLMALSAAYVRAGLLWAARSCALSATERCLAYFREEGQLVRFTLSCLEQLVLVELRLGRIAHILMAIELESILAPQLRLPDDRLKCFKEHRQLTECMLGVLILASSLPQLREMEQLPEVLEEIDLVVPKGFLLYALGYRDALRNEGFMEDRWSNDDIEDFMRIAFGQPGRLQMPPRPQIEIGSNVTYQTKVLGCQVTLQAPADTNAISVAEAVLGTIEAFFATSLGERIVPYRAEAKVVLEPAADLIEGLRFTQEDDDGLPFLCIQYPASEISSTPEVRQAFRSGLMELVPRFMLYIAVVDDFKAYMERIAGEERAFARALYYSEISVIQENVFGSSPKVLVRDWRPAGRARHYPLLRSHEWNDGVSITQIPLPDDKDQKAPDAESGPGTFLKKKAEQETHAERKIISIIDIPLWDKASWRAAFYFFDPRTAPLPVLCLGFQCKDAAEKIFSSWRKEFGTHDRDNKIRVSIIRGIQRTNRAAYRVFVGSNFQPEANSSSIITFIGRHQTMTPTTTENLDGFLKIVAGAKSYLLAPAHFVSETKLPDIGLGLAIQKEELVIRQAWEIGLNDIDAPAFLADDDPVIPPEVENPPINELLDLINKFG